jgi:DnaK suppressor protein
VTPDKLAAARARLEARAQEIRKAFERSKDQTTRVAPDSAIGRLTRVDALQAGYVSDELRRQMTAELARIDRALRSIDEGTYGICRRCEAPIPAARLEARPDAAFCVPCAEQAERSR